MAQPTSWRATSLSDDEESTSITATGVSAISAVHGAPAVSIAPALPVSSTPALTASATSTHECDTLLDYFRARSELPSHNSTPEEKWRMGCTPCTIFCSRRAREKQSGKR